MLHHYTTLLRRKLIRHPFQTMLHLFGLATGMAAAILILLYLHFELNYDRFHERADQVYRIETEALQTQSRRMEVQMTATPGLLGPYAKQDIPEIDRMARLYTFFLNEEVPLAFEGQTTSTTHVVAADAAALDIFSFDFLYGHPKNALNGPNKIMLAESVARQIFGNRNPVGQVLQSNLVHIESDFSPEYTLEVSGVYRDFPDNSSLSLHAIISAETDPALNDYYFKRFGFYTYVLLNPEVATEQVEQKLTAIYTKYLDPEVEPVLQYAEHRLVPLTAIHLESTGGYTYLYIFGAIGLLMLFIAMISYINLATAQASKRSKEVGVRKVMGSSRSQLIGQFLFESLSMSALALALGVGIVYLSLPIINQWLQLELTAAQLWSPQPLLGMLGILMIMGILGGSYPAFFLSGFQAVQNFQSSFAKGTPVRSALVAVQFAVVIFVLVSTGMIYEQLRYLSQKELGFNRTQIVRLAFASETDRQKIPALKTEIKRSPLISEVTTSSFLAGVGMPRRPLSADGSEDRAAQFVHFGRIDYDFFKTMDIELVAGRNFSPDHPSDATENIIVNEALARSFGLDQPVGEKVRYGDQGNPNFVRIIGVVKDFHQSSLHQPIAAQMFSLSTGSNHILVKIDQDITTGIAHLEKSWQAVFPEAPFAFHFLDEDVQRSYELDHIRGSIFQLFSGITLFIAFLGLFGLAAYTVRQRIKEISIRKVLGVSSWQVMLLISRKFLWLTALAALPAFGLAWYFMQQWLEEFAYQVDMNYAIFGGVLLLTLLLTLLTTGLHALKASWENPSQQLNQE